MHLIDLAQLTPDAIHAISSFVDQPAEPLRANVAWSFEGNGIRASARPAIRRTSGQLDR